MTVTKTRDRRKLRFSDVAELRAEIDRLLAADRTHTLVQLGNWTPGQIFGHLASWINYGYEGFPMGPPPFFIRWILRRRVRKYLRTGMPAGIHIPGTKEGTFGTEVLSIDEGRTRLTRALDRLERGDIPQYDSPAFGPMSVNDRIQLNLRHAELHLGFLLPK